MGGLTAEETNQEYYSYLAKRYKIRIVPRKAKVKGNYLRPQKLEVSSGKSMRFHLIDFLRHHRLGKINYR